MDTRVQSPGQLFQLPQTLVIPLFQRPYVWTEERQWIPLWEDVVRLVELRMDQAPSATHFLGAVVMQQSRGQMGFADEYSLIDGQQRLTTIQLLLNAASIALRDAGQSTSAEHLQMLTLHERKLGFEGAERLKVRHTNGDGVPFLQAMLPGDAPDLAAESAAHPILLAHRFFYDRVREWLADGDGDELPRRATALAMALSRGFEIVVISLNTEEDSQSIFETLNARGTPLTQADLVKNLVFQKLDAEGADIQQAYEQNWRLFDEPFWTNEVRLGRFTLPQVSLFLNHWLVAETGEEVRTPATFARFKHWLEYESTRSVREVVSDLHAQAVQYQAWITAATSREGAVDAVELFFYRSLAAGTRATTPLVLWLFDNANRVPRDIAEEALRWFESWVVRRAILGLSTGDMSRSVAQLISELREIDPTEVASRLRDSLTTWTTPTTYWPTDAEVERSLHIAPVYRTLSRSRLRMVLEAIEDDARGYSSGRRAWSGSRVPRDTMNIEHILPRQWRQNWPVATAQDEIDRDEHVHRLGNLTLLTTSLNSSVSNRAWAGKQEALTRHDVLLMNRGLRDAVDWDEASISRRTADAIDAVIRTWPVPTDHTVVPESHKGEADTSWIDFRHVVGVGLIEPGTTLRARNPHEATASVLADGRIEVRGTAYDSPSGAGKAVRGGTTNGWNFWILPDGRRLNALKEPYRRLLDEKRSSARSSADA
ncbi:DUF262 domain-containing protein [Brachybacterium sp. p3-SID1565]|uniref:DUF262 domain-containing protein n=1 Tax=Brachybacterium epidermidis TaxID=2781983 RepID=A0ABR9W4P1_9MICO|nr:MULTISPECIES: DUF262 domain-containing protein [Brachybacterium]MBE9404278.1 DUF262 domain-containing protein [Brachybacterium epidermidis]MCT1384398.1 DUF262 domain-containing protein [Brachybacterium sp. p3-SID1565]